MASMDVIRNELNYILEETMRLKRNEVQSLSFELPRAKSKLEAVSAAKKKVNSIVSNLSFMIEQLRSKSKAGEREKDVIWEETVKIKSEIEKIERGAVTEEKRRATMQGLKEAEILEALAFEKLKILIERTARDRVFASQYGPHITMSNFEYD